MSGKCGSDGSNITTRKTSLYCDNSKGVYGECGLNKISLLFTSSALFITTKVWVTASTLLSVDSEKGGCGFGNELQVALLQQNYQR